MLLFDLDLLLFRAPSLYPKDAENRHSCLLALGGQEHIKFFQLAPCHFMVGSIHLPSFSMTDVFSSAFSRNKTSWCAVVAMFLSVVTNEEKSAH